MANGLETSSENGGEQPINDQDLERQLGYTVLLSLSSGAGVAGGGVLFSEGHPLLGTVTMISPLLATIATRGLTKSFHSTK